MWTSITGVLLRCQRILVIVNGGDGAGGTEVVGWNIQRTLAWLAVIGKVFDVIEGIAQIFGISGCFPPLLLEVLIKLGLVWQLSMIFPV